MTEYECSLDGWFKINDKDKLYKEIKLKHELYHSNDKKLTNTKRNVKIGKVIWVRVW